MKNESGTIDSRNFRGRGRLSDLVAELDRQQSEKFDFVADQRAFVVAGNSEGSFGGIGLVASHEKTRDVVVEKTDSPLLPLAETAFRQLCKRTTPEIPRKFASELVADRGDIAVDLLQGLLDASPKRNLFRVLDGRVRAILSDRYRVMDSRDIAFQALDIAREANGEVVECSLTDNHFRLKLTTREIFDNLDGAREGHDFITPGIGGNPEHHVRTDFGNGNGSGNVEASLVNPMITISNSETGKGGFNVSLGIVYRYCVNGMILDKTVARTHLGETLAAGVYSDETMALSTEAILEQTKDIIRSAFDPDRFRKMIVELKDGESHEIESPGEAVGNLVVGGHVSESRKDDLLTYFARDYKQTRFGLAQAVSRLAQDTDNPDQSEDYEALSGRIALPSGRELVAVR